MLELTLFHLEPPIHPSIHPTPLGTPRSKEHKGQENKDHTMQNYLLTFLAVAMLLASSTFADFCPLAVHSPKTSKMYCGGKYIPHADTSARALISSTPGVAFYDCAEACYGDFGCKSLAYDTSRGVCSLYRRYGKGMGVDQNKENYIHFCRCFPKTKAHTG